MAISVSLSVLPEDHEQATKVIEALSRVSAGLAFDGMTVNLMVTNFDPGDEDEDDGSG